MGVQVDADKNDVGGEGEVDFKENAKFGSHMKEKGEAASDFSKSKTLGEQRQYLPIFSVRDELLQVTVLEFLLLLYCDFLNPEIVFKPIFSLVIQFDCRGIACLVEGRCVNLVDIHFELLYITGY